MRTKLILTAALALLIFAWASTSEAKSKPLVDDNMPLGCIAQASSEYGLPPRLLHALYLVEHGRVGYATVNSNGTLDHGPFGINSIFLKQLSNYGIDQSTLSWSKLVNARVAAWFLRTKISQANGNVWEGVGNYRSKTPKYHNEEIYRVSREYMKLENVVYEGNC